MLPGMNMGKMMKQAQEMQKQMAKIQDDLKDRVVEASAGGGMVVVHFNGRQELMSLKIDPEVLKSGDAEMLQDLITAAINEGIKKSQDLAKEEMGKVMGGLGLPPGLF